MCRIAGLLHSEDLFDLGRAPGRVGGGQIDLVEDGHDLEVVLDGLVAVGQGLGLNALGGVDQEHRPLAGGQRTAHLVAEVDVARGVDQVEGVVLPRHPDVLGLDGDPPLPLDVHGVEVLLAHQAGVDRPGQLEDAVRQGRLAVIDVADDGEIADAVDGEHGTASVPKPPELRPAGRRCRGSRRRGSARGPDPRRWEPADRAATLCGLRSRDPRRVLRVRSQRRSCRRRPSTPVRRSHCGTDRPGPRPTRTTRNPVANIKSQIKRNRQTVKRQARNKAVRSELRTRTKRAIERHRGRGGGLRGGAAVGHQADRQGGGQGRHPQEPGGQPQVPPDEAGRLGLRRRLTHRAVGPDGHRR